MIEVSAEEFSTLVAEAFERIPESVKSRLEKVALLARDEVTDEQRTDLGMHRDEQLLGLFEGVTRGDEVTAGSHLPPTITLFRNAILEHCETLDEVRREISDTLWHEVAHYLGLDESEVRHEEHRHDRQHRS